MALFGASLPDFDHNVNENNVYILIITGLVIFGILYFLNLPYFIGILICLLAMIFYFSSHRGFTHSIFGIIILTVLVFFIIILGSLILLSIKINSVAISEEIAIGGMILFLGILSLNRKLILPFILLFSVGLVFLKSISVNYIILFFSIFLGVLSHLILDSFTPSGVKILVPFSSRKFHKDFGIAMLISLGILSIPQLIQIFKFVSDYNLLYLLIF